MNSPGNCKQPTALIPRGEVKGSSAVQAKLWHCKQQKKKKEVAVNFPTFTTDVASPAHSQPALELPAVPVAKMKINTQNKIKGKRF